LVQDAAFVAMGGKRTFVQLLGHRVRYLKAAIHRRDSLAAIMHPFPKAPTRWRDIIGYEVDGLDCRMADGLPFPT
jgi:hypothetical protein